jgi:uncharacterized protein YgiM (DUF1202 family)
MLTNAISRRGVFRLIAGTGTTAGLAMIGQGPLRAIAQTTDTNENGNSAENVQRVNTDLLNLRAGAGLSFDIIETLTAGTEVAADTGQRKAADGVNWIFVTVVATGTSGWVDSQYIGFDSSGTPLSSRWVSVADANLRDGAGLTFNVLAMLPLGQEVAVTGDSRDADGYTWYPVTAAGKTGWLADIVLTDVQPSGFSQGSSVTVSTDLLNLREAAGTDSPSLGTYAFGTKATIVSASATVVDGANWYQVEVDGDGKVGWFIEEFITASTGGSVEDKTITIADGPLNLRQEPGLAGEIVAEVPTGATATLIAPGQTAADGYQWINIKLADQTSREGWVASEFVSFV